MSDKAPDRPTSRTPGKGTSAKGKREPAADRGSPAGRGRARKLTFQVTLTATVFPELFGELVKMPARDRSLACLRLADRGVGVRWATLLGTVNLSHAGQGPKEAGAPAGSGTAGATAAHGGDAVSDGTPRRPRSGPNATPHGTVHDELEGFSLG